LKSISNSYWQNPNIGATNESGFSALPGGFRYPGSGSATIGDFGSWWSSSEVDPFEALARYLYYNNISVR
jgi:hypothetical protein